MTKKITEIREAQTDKEIEQTEDAKNYSNALNSFYITNFSGTLVGILAGIGLTQIITGNPTDMSYISIGTALAALAAIKIKNDLNKNNVDELREKKILEIKPAENENKELELLQTRIYNNHLNSLMGKYIPIFLTSVAMNTGAQLIAEPITIGNIPVGAVILGLGIIANAKAFFSASKHFKALRSDYNELESKTR